MDKRLKTEKSFIVGRFARMMVEAMKFPNDKCSDLNFWCVLEVLI
jgi:hypothetical protein